jgi:5-methylcytosine-specific restriction endonuclease McrA
MSKMLAEHVLVLNKSWNPIDTCTVASAFSKLFCDTAKFLDVDTFILHDVDGWLSLPKKEGERAIVTSRVDLRVPEIVILTSDAMPKRRIMQFSRRNLMRRDNHTCQYCGAKEQLTVDHIRPRTKGGKSNWTNCVMACLPCNSKKADRAPEEVGLALQPRTDLKVLYPHDISKWAKPYEPAWSPVFRVATHNLRPAWHKFLPDIYTKSSIVVA